jgi:uncharacterized membrane protein SirB2
MSIEFYQIIHFFSVIILTAVTFWALASPQPENRRRVMMFSGILALLALVSGFGMLARLGLSMVQGWVFVKLACWLGFTAVTSLAYRRSEGQRRPLVLLTVVAVFLAVYMVVTKPF